jgi:hypothetical protein
MPYIGLGLHVLVALFFAVHALKTGRPMYWLIILFSFPLLGSIAYFFAEYLPDMRIDRGVRRAGAVLAKVVDPTRDLRAAREAFEITPTAQNEARLAAALMDADKLPDAIAHYRNCLAGPFGNEPDLRVGAARAYLAIRNFDEAVRLLDLVRAETPNYRPTDTLILLGHARWAKGNTDGARAALAQAAKDHSGIEGRAEYAMFCLDTGDVETARAIQRDIDVDAKTWNARTRKLHKATLNRLAEAWSRAGHLAG